MLAPELSVLPNNAVDTIDFAGPFLTIAHELRGGEALQDVGQVHIEGALDVGSTVFVKIRPDSFTLGVDEDNADLHWVTVDSYGTVTVFGQKAQADKSQNSADQPAGNILRYSGAAARQIFAAMCELIWPLVERQEPLP